MPLLGHQYIVGQSAIPPFYVSNPSVSIKPDHADIQCKGQPCTDSIKSNLYASDQFDTQDINLIVNKS